MRARIPAVLLVAATVSACFETIPAQPSPPGHAAEAPRSETAVNQLMGNFAPGVSHDEAVHDQAITPSGGGGGHSGGGSTRQQEGAPQIDDVIWLETNQSVAGDQPPAALVGALAGKPLTLRIVGRNFSKPEQRLEDWAFPLPAGILTQTAIGNTPHNRVLLDGSIPLQPSADGVFSSTELTMVLETKGILDLYLKGTHRLTVINGQTQATVPIQVGDAEHPGRYLMPVIKSVELAALPSPKLGLEAEEDEEEVLRITGENLLLDYHRVYATINGQRAYFHAVQVRDTDPVEMVGYCHLPKGFVRRNPGNDTLKLATPFGLTFASF